MASDSGGYFDDSPRSNPETQDELGYRRFARCVAEALAGIQAPQGYVVGLHGRWGSGKSTVINFVDYYLKGLEKDGDEGAAQILRVDFRPWIVSGHDDLVSAFFKLLREEIEKHDRHKPTPMGRLVGFGRTIGRWLHRLLNRGDADRAIDTIAKIGVIVDITGGFAASAGAIAAKRSFGAAVDRWLQEPTLQAVYSKLVKQLAARPGKILVSIDDIDRLSSEEIRTIMQMVKSVGRLPNVVYILSYDRTIVWNALDSMSPRAAGDPSFAEKIVQLELELPVPDKNKLLRILDRELNPIVGGTPNSYRWAQLLTEGLHRWIKVPRDVIRLANSTKFVWPGLKGEVDAQDVVIMEGMRLFDQDLFAWVRSNRDFILGQGRWRMTVEQESKDYSDLFESTLGLNRNDRIELLCALFPRLTKNFKKNAFVSDPDNYGGMLVKRRIAVEQAYDAYFSLFPLDDVLTKADLEDFINNLDDRDHLARVMQRFADRKGNQGQSLVGDLFEQVRYALDSDEARPTEALLRALFDVGDAILTVEDDRILILGARAQIAFLAKDVVRALGDDRAREILLDIFASTESVAFAADFWVDRGRELGVFKDDGGGRDGPLSLASFEALGAPLKALIDRKAADGSLENVPFYFDILRTWAHIEGTPKSAEAWLSRNVLADGHFLAKVAYGLLSHSVSDDGSRRYGFSRSGSELSDSSRAFYNFDVLLEASEKWADAAWMSQDEIARISALRIGLRKFKAGEPTTDW